jgi:Tfp pilus assembly pilus retraction ATPase PilT
MTDTTGKRFKEIDFLDLYLSKDGSSGWIKDSKGNVTVLGGEHREDMEGIARLCDAEEGNGADEYTVKYDGVRYRASAFQAEDGFYRTLRKQPITMREFEQLGLYPGVAEQLMAPGLKGLILIAGKTGAGKTTTASALIKARLKRYGGIAITNEDPPEMPISGQHGPGVCFQIHAKRENGGFSEALRKTVRRNPDIILLGEIRDNETASEALRASVNGHLVIATIHAGDPIEAINRLISMSSDIDRVGARELLADGLCMILAQYFDAQGRLMSVPLSFTVAETVTSIKTKLRKGEIAQLTSDIKTQVNLLARNAHSQVTNRG